MRKFLRAVLMGWIVFATPVVVASAAVQGCAIFASDPVGASLLTFKDSYEAAVKTAGRMYVEGLITEPQLRGVRTEANKFYVAYQAAVIANEQKKLEPSDARMVNLRFALDALEKVVLALSTTKN